MATTSIELSKYLYISQNNFINKLDKSNGQVIKSLCCGNTPIKNIISSGDYFYVLSDYYDFDNSKYLSNIVCIDKLLEIKWYAELPEENDAYSNMKKTAANIVGYTWNGWECTIDKISGSITRKIFTK
jgi:hypothetical protein